MSPSSKLFTALGDSKTASNGWQAQLIYNLGAIGITASLSPAQFAGNGYTSLTLRNGVDAWLAGTATTPDFVLIDVGVNDWSNGITNAQFNTNLAYILDAVHAKWAGAIVVVTYPWKRGYDTRADEYAIEIDDVLSTRSAWAVVGGDERLYLKGGDDGACCTTDGVHPNATGYTSMAYGYQDGMGY